MAILLPDTDQGSMRYNSTQLEPSPDRFETAARSSGLPERVHNANFRRLPIRGSAMGEESETLR
jgi:hypothetical protein